jgi:hypothetical protein
MSSRPLVALGIVMTAFVACNRPQATPSPTPGTGPAAAPATAPAQLPASGNPTPGARAGGAPQRPRLSADSMAVLRTNRVNTMLAELGPRADLPAEQVFKNIQVLRGRTARQLLNIMNLGYGRATGMTCGGCHITSDFASDSLGNKRTARIMHEMVNAINTQHLSKLGGQPPTVINCMTCHRGNREPDLNFNPLTGPPPGGRSGAGRRFDQSLTPHDRSTRRGSPAFGKSRRAARACAAARRQSPCARNADAARIRTR